MSEERILQAVERIEGRIDILDKKIDTVSHDLNDFKEETRENFKAVNEQISATNTRIDELDTNLDNFKEETRDNFVSMSNMIRQTNERITAVDKRITDLDKKMEKRFQENNRDIGIALNSAFESIDRNYVKIKDIS